VKSCSTALRKLGEPLALRDRVVRGGFYYPVGRPSECSAVAMLPKVRSREAYRRTPSRSAHRLGAPPAFSLPRLRVHGRSRGMARDNRRPEHPICNNTNEQEDRNHDRWNEVSHNLSFIRRNRTGGTVGVISRVIPAHGRKGPERKRGRRRIKTWPGDYCAPKARQASNITGVQIFPDSRTGLLPTQLGRPPAYWQKPHQSLGDNHAVRS
jgi:hypothetical protein